MVKNGSKGGFLITFGTTVTLTFDLILPKTAESIVWLIVIHYLPVLSIGLSESC